MPRASTKTTRERLCTQRDRMERLMSKLIREEEVAKYTQLATVYRQYLKEIDAMPDIKKDKVASVASKIDAVLEASGSDVDSDANVNNETDNSSESGMSPESVVSDENIDNNESTVNTVSKENKVSIDDILGGGEED